MPPPPNIFTCTPAREAVGWAEICTPSSLLPHLIPKMILNIAAASPTPYLVNFTDLPLPFSFDHLIALSQLPAPAGTPWEPTGYSGQGSRCVNRKCSPLPSLPPYPIPQPRLHLCSRPQSDVVAPHSSSIPRVLNKQFLVEHPCFPQYPAYLLNPASDIQKQVLPRSPSIHVYQDRSRVSFQAKYKHHTLLRTREKTETKGINTHPTKRKPDVSTQNYNLPLPTCLDARINTGSIIARTRCLH